VADMAAIAATDHVLKPPFSLSLTIQSWTALIVAC